MYGNEEQIRLDAARFNQLYQIGNVLTDSANGVLYHLYRKSDNFHCVLKVVPKNKCKRWGFIKSGNVNRVVPIEFKLHYAARACCDRVCDVFDWFEMDDVFCLVIEFINGYDLFELSNRVGGMNEIHVRHIMRQIVDIVVTLARHQIVHRDIKDENIMINELSQAKLIDFGCAIEFCDNDVFTSFSGTSEFYPFEWFQHGYYCPLGGAVWSLGCLMFTLLTGDVPYVDEQAVKENHRRPLTPCHIDAERAIHSMMDVNVNRRTKLYDILNLAFFATTNDRLMPISSLQTTKLPQNMSLTSTQF